MNDSDPMSDEAAAMPDEPTGSEFHDDAGMDNSPDPVATTRRPLSARAAAVVGARVVIGVVGISTAAAVVLGATFLPIPSLNASPPSETVTPVPTAQQLTCPGPLLRLSDDSGAEASAVFTLGTAVTRFSSSTGAVEQARITASDAETGEAVAYPLVISAAPTDGNARDSVRLSGAQSQSVAVGDYVGFAAASCRAVGSDSWLVGGATTTGRTTLISLTNPTEVGSVVTLNIFDEQGAVSAAGTAGIVVPPNGQRLLSLAGFAPGVKAPVVHVMSSGGQITAELQQSIIRGLDAGGVEIIGATVPPSRSVVIPGVVNSDLEAAQALRGGPNAGTDVIAAIRVFVPGDESTDISVTLTPEDPEAAPTTFSLDLSAGVATDIPLEELATGTYTIQIDSTEPIVAAARTTSALLASAGAVAATDFAWFVASPALESDTQFTVADGLPAIAHFANPTNDVLTVTLSAVNGEAEEFIIEAGETVRVPVSNGTTYTLSHGGRVHVNVTQHASGFGSAYAVDPQTPGSSPLTIFP